MPFTRWYDKDNRLKFIINVLEKLDEETRNSLASDILQILINSKYPDTDELIESINANYTLAHNRWYDHNETLHSAVEMLRFADTEDKKELINEFLYSIIDIKGLETLSSAESVINQQRLIDTDSSLSSEFSSVTQQYKQDSRKTRD